MLKQVSQEEFDKILDQCKKEEQARADKMPSEQDALKQMHEAYTRLKELGWNDAIYCPKDGTHFSTVEAGSTGVHDSNYIGEWPTGGWWTYDGDMWPSRPILWRERKEDDPNIDLGTAMEYQCCKST